MKVLVTIGRSALSSLVTFSLVMRVSFMLPTMYMVVCFETHDGVVLGSGDVASHTVPEEHSVLRMKLSLHTKACRVRLTQTLSRRSMCPSCTWRFWLCVSVLRDTCWAS